MARQNENFLDRVMRYGGVQRRPQYAPRNNVGFVPRGGYGRQQVPQYLERPQYVQRQVQQPQPQTVQRQIVCPVAASVPTAFGLGLIFA
jgi:hypothetical protein